MKPYSLKIAALLFLLPVLVYAQDVKQAVKPPMDDTNEKITYAKVVELKGKGPGDLYHNALLWANSYYKNPGDVIRERDSVNGKIVCKARFKIMNPPDKKGFAAEAGNVMYTLTLQFKEGRYRYEMTDFNWKQQSYYACERWMDKAKASYEPRFDFFIEQIHTKALEVTTNLEKNMPALPSAKTDDW